MSTMCGQTVCIVLITFTSLFFVLLVVCLFAVIWLYRRYSSAKECLLLLRRLDTTKHRKRRVSIRPPSTIAPPLPPKRPTPTLNGKTRQTPAGDRSSSESSPPVIEEEGSSEES
ncbi:uncharacterized protein LOC122267456 [Penaeus japonicus]|uniref:uncharacterized protein LOC122267456 n=1 Tax=Penaeus japonicus TaxID=27405 RepID=UPI001C70E5C5|nr:uncharacterized protein LOC122267456 [Penaeus japonicus]